MWGCVCVGCWGWFVFIFFFFFFYLCLCVFGGGWGGGVSGWLAGWLRHPGGCWGVLTTLRGRRPQRAPDWWVGWRLYSAAGLRQLPRPRPLLPRASAVRRHIIRAAIGSCAPVLLRALACSCALACSRAPKFYALACSWHVPPPLAPLTSATSLSSRECNPPPLLPPPRTQAVLLRLLFEHPAMSAPPQRKALGEAGQGPREGYTHDYSRSEGVPRELEVC